MAGTAAAGMISAFGKVVPVQIVEFDQDSETGEPIAAIITPSGTRAYVKRSSLLPAPAAPVTEPGIYQHDGWIYKVQQSKTSDNLYAKRLTIGGGRRLTDADTIERIEFEYAPGAIRDLSADERLGLEEAKAFGIKYGFCVQCGAFLKDATSVANGIGPVCEGRL